MVAQIVFTQNNITNIGKGNNQLVYSFPNSVSFPNHEVAISNISLYYSWVNIDSNTLNNNTFYYLWEQAGDAGLLSFPVVIPNGLYEISTINYFLQFTMIQNGHYLVDTATGNNVYFIEMVVNPSNYTVQINTYPIPAISGTTPPTGYTLGTGWTYNGTGFIPTVCMSNPNLIAGVPTVPHTYTNFYKIVGYDPAFTSNSNTYTIATTTANKSSNSSTAPQVQPNPTIFFAISNIDNKYSNPSTIVFQLSPTVAFGELITITPPQFAFNKLIPGTYNGIRLAILGTNFQPLSIIDPEITITMVIRDRKDISLTDALATATGGK